jgi:hypothetical protein
MRVSAVRTTSAVLLRYFTRRVLAVGILEQRPVRIGLLALSVLVLVILTAGNYLFLGSVDINTSTLMVVYKLGATSAIFWVMTIFLFIKILFWRSDEMIVFTWQLPLSHRERVGSLLVFEGAIILSVAGALFVPLAIALPLLFGLQALLQILIGIAFPAITTFLLLSIFVNVLLNVFSHRSLRTLGSVFVPASLVGLIFGFNAIMPEITYSVSGDALNNKNTLHGVDLYTYLAERFSAWAALGLFLFSSSLFLVLMLALVPRTYPKMTRNVNVTTPARNIQQVSYLAALSRRVDSWLLLVTTYVIGVALFFKGNNYFGYAALIPSAQGIYAYSATRTLRLMPGYRASAGTELRRVLLSQGWLALLYSSPLLALYVFRWSSAVQVLGVLAALTGAIIMVTFLGVLFPPDKENPFSIMTSLTICLVLAIILISTLGILRLPLALNILVIILLHVLALFYSVQAIKSLRKKERYA